MYETAKRISSSSLLSSLFFITTFHRVKKEKKIRHIGTQREQVIHRSVHKHTITCGGGFEIQAGDVAFIN